MAEQHGPRAWPLALGATAAATLVIVGLIANGAPTAQPAGSPRPVAQPAAPEVALPGGARQALADAVRGASTAGVAGAAGATVPAVAPLVARTSTGTSEVDEVLLSLPGVGLCTQVFVEGSNDSSGGCGPMDEALETHRFTQSDPTVDVLYGSASEAVARVQIVLPAGPTSDVPLSTATPDTQLRRFFVVALPAGTRSFMVVGLDSAGAIVATSGS